MDAATLAVRSLVLLHDVLERLLVEVATRLVLIRALIDALRSAGRVGHHQVLLVAGAGDLRLHLKVVRLVLLLAEAQDDFIDDLVGWVRGLAPAAWLNQI